MSKSIRIYNITRGYYLKYNQALHAIEQCACAWVLEGRTIRNLSLAESIAARNEQARKIVELPASEERGIRYKAPERDAAAMLARATTLKATRLITAPYASHAYAYYLSHAPTSSRN